MGNCLVVQENVVKVIKPDGKILEYQAPIEVRQVLSDFPAHAIADSLQALQYLLPDTNLRGGDHLYYLMPLQLTPPKVLKKKKVRFSIPEELEAKDELVQGSSSGVVRIKLVISKQALQEMLKKGGVSVDDMVLQLQDEERVQKIDVPERDSDHKEWEPVLESIPDISH